MQLAIYVCHSTGTEFAEVVVDDLSKNNQLPNSDQNPLVSLFCPKTICILICKNAYVLPHIKNVHLLPQPGKLDYGSDAMQLYGQLDGVHLDSNQKIKLIRLGKLINKDVIRECSCRCNERDKKTYFQLS